MRTANSTQLSMSLKTVAKCLESVSFLRLPFHECLHLLTHKATPLVQRQPSARDNIRNFVCDVSRDKLFKT